MKLHNPLLSLGTDALSGKPYHLCSSKVRARVYNHYDTVFVTHALRRTRIHLFGSSSLYTHTHNVMC